MPSLMRAPGGVLLMSCYELGRHPLALAWPLAFFARAGFHGVRAIDLAVEAIDDDAVRAARLIAVSVPMHTALRRAAALLPRLRAVNPGAHVCLYGDYAVLNGSALRALGVDTVLAGEVGDALVDLARGLEAGERGAGETAGGAAVPAGAFATRPSVRLDRLDFPVPVRDSLPPLSRYAHLEADGRQVPAGAVEATRGCRHLCRHCPIPPIYGGRLFAVPREVVLADVDQLVAAGAGHVTFADPDFLNAPGHAMRVARALHQRHPTITFDVTAKVEHLLAHRALLAELRALGCAFVVTAAESLSDAVLAALEKGHTASDVREALRVTRGAGLVLRPTWLPFAPWARLEDYAALLDFVADEELIDHVDAVQYGIRLLVPPGSRLLETDPMLPHLRGLSPEAFAWRWEHPDPRMDALQRAVAAAAADAAQRLDTARAARLVHRLAREWTADLLGGPRGVRRVPLDVLNPSRVPRLTEPWFC